MNEGGGNRHLANLAPASSTHQQHSSFIIAPTHPDLSNTLFPRGCPWWLVGSSIRLDRDDACSSPTVPHHYLFIAGVGILHSSTTYNITSSSGFRCIKFLVTEDDVISLVEKAENLWARVEKLRTEAKNLSLKAESLGQEAETSTADAMNSLKGSISAEKIEMANNAQNLSIDLGSLLEQVERATQMADEIEVLADEALAASEAAFEQHLIDFPEDG